MITHTAKSSYPQLTHLLPGPDRKRKPAPYHFRLCFRNAQPQDIGCVATWEVLGGRQDYQISLERTDASELRWHCCCPDAVYREDLEHRHRCKHIQGLIEAFETISASIAPVPTAA